jgi:hypothetical protein
MLRPATFLLKVYKADDLPRSLYFVLLKRIHDQCLPFSAQWIVRFYME